MRQAMREAALPLAQCGVSGEEMTLYALSHIKQLLEEDAAMYWPLYPRRTAEAYCAVHVLGAGPVTLSAYRAVRDASRAS